jgi:hypothetical protein
MVGHHDKRIEAHLVHQADIVESVYDYAPDDVALEDVGTFSSSGCDEVQMLGIKVWPPSCGHEIDPPEGLPDCGPAEANLSRSKSEQKQIRVALWAGHSPPILAPQLPDCSLWIRDMGPAEATPR